MAEKGVPSFVRYLFIFTGSPASSSESPESSYPPTSLPP
jgi:hypothetical protein